MRSYLVLLCITLCVAAAYSSKCGDCGVGKACNEDSGVCECQRFTCAMLSWECGEMKDGCGGSITCGSCKGSDVCSVDGKCLSQEAHAQRSAEIEAQTAENSWAKPARSVDGDEDFDRSMLMMNPHYRQQLRDAKLSETNEESARSTRSVASKDEHKAKRREHHKAQQKARSDYFIQQRAAIEQQKLDTVKPHPMDPQNFAKRLTPEELSARQEYIIQQRHAVHESRDVEKMEMIKAKQIQAVEKANRLAAEDQTEYKGVPAFILYGLPAIGVCALIAAAALFVHQMKQDNVSAAGQAEDTNPLLRESSRHAITIAPSPLLKAHSTGNLHDPPVVQLRTAKSKLMNSPAARRSPKISSPRLRSSQTFTPL